MEVGPTWKRNKQKKGMENPLKGQWGAFLSPSSGPELGSGRMFSVTLQPWHIQKMKLKPPSEMLCFLPAPLKAQINWKSGFNMTHISRQSCWCSAEHNDRPDSFLTQWTYSLVQGPGPRFPCLSLLQLLSDGYWRHWTSTFPLCETNVNKDSDKLPAGGLEQAMVLTLGLAAEEFIKFY